MGHAALQGCLLFRQRATVIQITNSAALATFLFGGSSLWDVACWQSPHGALQCPWLARGKGHRIYLWKVLGIDVRQADLWVLRAFKD